ncbi:MAG: transporter permease [Anaerocolumna sp.]|nr:transporter permease [Anaerocolumna sp.]
MKSYLSLITISAKVHKRQNRMTLICIIFAVFLVTAVFSMADMGVRMEKTRLLNKHGSLALKGFSSRPKDKIFWNDALYRNEQTADYSFC